MAMMIGLLKHFSVILAGILLTALFCGPCFSGAKAGGRQSIPAIAALLKQQGKVNDQLHDLRWRPYRPLSEDERRIAIDLLETWDRLRNELAIFDVDLVQKLRLQLDVHEIRPHQADETQKRFPRNHDWCGFELAKEARHASLDGVKQKLSAGCDVNAKNGIGESALLAVLQGDEEFGPMPDPEAYDLVVFLLASGADISIRDARGWSALMYAACGGSARIVSILLQNGADPSVTSYDGKTALTLAQAARHDAVIKVLVRGR
jgi:hypothetical protein